MVARLDNHAFRFWTLMHKMRKSPNLISREFARINELPTLAASTPFPKLAARIHRELQTQDVA